MKKKLNPVHPGEILKEEYLDPMEITAYRLAKDINVPATRISEIVKGKRSISGDTALRLSKYFGLSRDYWIKIQARYDLDIAEDQIGNKLDKEVTVYKKVS